jgi:geranylgeranyl pyrophosphate synthase
MNTVLDEIYRPIKKDLNRVEELLNRELKKDSPTSRLNESILNNPGKRLRPALCLFSASSILSRQTAEKVDNGLIMLAAALELIHNAALIHDDVVDHSALRRGRQTIHTGYSNEAAIAFGGYLYSKGLEFLSRLGNSEIMNCMISTVSDMCEGELIQILNRGNFQLKREVYMTIVRKKTASLMASSCATAVILTNKKGSILNSVSSFGLNFGIAFQIIDDCLDLMGREEDLGKPLSSDLKMGEVTLPLLFLMESGVCKDIEELMRLIYSSKTKNKEEETVRDTLLSSGALHKAKDLAARHVEEAKRSLRFIENSIFKEGLMALADLTKKRLYLGAHSTGV